jgi:pimeloyl-ACP methyl ester carboxylesterase
MTAGVRRAFAALAHGAVHYAECGEPGRPAVLLLHQTPRSWAEYKDVLPLLGERFRAIAMDTAGFGDSQPVAEPGIEAWARVAVQLLDALGVQRAHVVGHHTGGVIAVELAAAHAKRVASLVLSSTPLTDAAFREARRQRPPIDAVAFQADGSHLAALWQRRQAFYPAGRPDLLHAFVADAMKVADVEAGHRAVASYRMEDRVALLGQPTLLIHAPDDPFAAPHTAHWQERLPHAVVATIDGGGVPLPDQCPEAFAHAVIDFLAGPA